MSLPRLAPLLATLTLMTPGAAAGASSRPGFETWNIPLDAAAAEGMLAARTPPEDTPNEADVADCMRQPGADTERGHVRSRYLWCLRTIARLVTRDGSQARIHYQMVGYGRDDGERNVRIFFRVSKVEAVGLNPPPPSTVWRVGLECEPGDSSCYTGGSIAQNLVEWDSGGEWWSLLVGSTETGPPESDNVAYHRWRLRGSSPGYNDAVLPWQEIRCDSADYFQIFGQRRPRACIFYDVVPYLSYSTADPRVSEVAGHIEYALDFPSSTVPTVPAPQTKRIPGKYEGPNTDGAGLHRIARGSQTRANRREVRRACTRRPPYQDNGLDPPPASGRHCDEFPFASTLEGAASPNWDFSVSAVDARQNCSAGGLLNWYLTTDRILYGQDEYFVRITDNPPGYQEDRKSVV